MHWQDFLNEGGGSGGQASADAITMAGTGASGCMPPVFRLVKAKDEISGATELTAIQDSSTFFASKKYENKNGGTTTYEMNVRLSTGRYKETWTPDKGDAFGSVGNCYNARDFGRVTAPAKKKKRSDLALDGAAKSANLAVGGWDLITVLRGLCGCLLISDSVLFGHALNLFHC